MPRVTKDPASPKKPRVPRKKADAAEFPSTPPETSPEAPRQTAPAEAQSPTPLQATPAPPAATEAVSGRRSAQPPVPPVERVADDDLEPTAPPPLVEPRTLQLHQLQPMPITKLSELAKEFGIENYGTLKRQEIIFQIVQRNLQAGGTIYTRGTLEVMPEGFGFLRSAAFNYLPCPEDIYVSPSQIRRFDLQSGDDVEGQIRPPKEKEKFYALLKVEKVHPLAPDVQQEELVVFPAPGRAYGVIGKLRGLVRGVP